MKTVPTIVVAVGVLALVVCVSSPPPRTPPRTPPPRDYVSVPQRAPSNSDDPCGCSRYGNPGPYAPPEEFWAAAMCWENCGRDTEADKAAAARAAAACGNKHWEEIGMDAFEKQMECWSKYYK
jgi:hypothetical protein